MDDGQNHNVLNRRSIFQEDWPYENDPHFGDIWKTIQDGGSVKDFHMNGSRLIFQGKSCEPALLIPSVVACFHNKAPSEFHEVLFAFKRGIAFQVSRQATL